MSIAACHCWHSPAPNHAASNWNVSQSVPINNACVVSHTAWGIAVPGHQHLTAEAASIEHILKCPPSNTGVGAQSDNCQQSLDHLTVMFASKLHCG